MTLPVQDKFSPARRAMLMLPLLSAGTAALAAGPPDGEPALACLQDLLQAYSEGRFDAAEALLAPQMTGYAQLVSAMHESANSSKQIVITLSDTSTSYSADMVVIRTRWEKRFLALPAMAARRSSGRATYIMRRQEGAWRLFANDGDNIFAAHLQSLPRTP